MSALSWDAEPVLGPAAPELANRFVGPKLGEEVAQALEEHVAPKLTELVWLKLEEENAKFFQAYYTRLKLKDQIVLFNHLLEQQVMALQRMPWAMGPPGAALAPRPGLPGPSLALHAGLPVPGMHPRQDGRAAGGGSTASGEVALDADFAGLAELGLPGMSLPSPGGADGGGGLLSGPPHSLAFPSGASDVAGKLISSKRRS
ncbi:hypothetical protein WJX81_005996 [Elliptochloris bilobata]|uniref:Uncharacterized protein n=1 Tax=Elliptochloris bilobata TaxID=381761 RepID=A0AAW1S5V9_9CHLO